MLRLYYIASTWLKSILWLSFESMDSARYWQSIVHGGAHVITAPRIYNVSQRLMWTDCRKLSAEIDRCMSDCAGRAVMQFTVRVEPFDCPAVLPQGQGRDGLNKHAM